MSNEAYDANDEDQLDAGAEPSSAPSPGQGREDPTVDEHGVTSYYSTRKMRNDVLDGLYDSGPSYRLLKRSRQGDYWIVTPFDFTRLTDYNALMMSLSEPVRVPPGSRSYQTTSVNVGGQIIRNVPVYRYDDTVEDVTQPEPEEPPILPAPTSTVTPPPATTPNPHPTREEVTSENNATVNPVTEVTEVPSSPVNVPAPESVVPPDSLDPRGTAQIPGTAGASSLPAPVTGPAPVTADCNTSSTSAPGTSIDNTDDARAGRTNAGGDQASTTPSTSPQSTTPSTSASSSVSSGTGAIVSNGPVYQYRAITQFADRYDFKTGKKIRE